MDQSGISDAVAAAQALDVVKTITNVDSCEVILSDGTKIVVSKFKTKHLAFMIELLQKSVEVIGLDEDGNLSISTKDTGKILKLLAVLPDELNKLIKNLSTVDDPEELDIDDALAIIVKIIEVNKGFFIQRIKPLLDQLKGQVGSLLT